jgi:hypothetical protein
MFSSHVSTKLGPFFEVFIAAFFLTTIAFMYFQVMLEFTRNKEGHVTIVMGAPETKK